MTGQASQHAAACRKKKVLHWNTAITRGQHVACFSQRQHIMIYPFFLNINKWISLSDGIRSVCELTICAYSSNLCTCTGGIVLPCNAYSENSVRKLQWHFSTEKHSKFCHTKHYQFLVLKIQQIPTYLGIDVIRSLRREGDSVGFFFFERHVMKWRQI